MSKLGPYRIECQVLSDLVKYLISQHHHAWRITSISPCKFPLLYSLSRIFQILSHRFISTTDTVKHSFLLSILDHMSGIATIKLAI